ncbi:transposon Tf2-6 polyprotein [Trichonephila clavipes]|nr:transposon Tf2-6 polyprotein [Trichonephila clavipes]
MSFPSFKASLELSFNKIMHAHMLQRLVKTGSAQHMQLLPWPAYSPDMSPIEHVGDLVGRCLTRDPRTAASKDEFLLRIPVIWNSLPQADIQNLFDSMSHCIATLIAARVGCNQKLFYGIRYGGSDWPAIKAFRAKTEQNLNNLLREYKDIFDDKLGEINNYEAKLKLRHGVKPIFCRVRTVPFALKGRVENEIDRLEKEGIIEKVDCSEWATPVVPVVKSDGSIRLCADNSVTLNPNLIVPQHPLPRLDEILVV